jgi:hypothetical protein
MSEKPEALRLAEELEALNGAKRDYGGIGGQMLGCEQYRLVASGSSFAALPNSADALLRQHAEIERLREALRGIAKIDFRNVDSIWARLLLREVVDKTKDALRREDV